MKIVVPVKRVPDADQKIRVCADGTSIDTSQLTSIINPFDAIALEEAVCMREGGHNPSATDIEIITVSIGDADYQEQLRAVLAMGADRDIRIDWDQPLDPWNTACVLKAVVEKESPDLVVMGKQAVDGDCNQTGQFLAALLDWPQATFASRIEYGVNRLCVDRETDAGIETVELPLPAIVTVDLRLNEPRYASLPGIMKAKKKEIVEINMASWGVDVTPRLRTLSVRMEKTARKQIRVNNTSEFANCLREAIKPN